MFQLPIAPSIVVRSRSLAAFLLLLATTAHLQADPAIYDANAALNAGEISTAEILIKNALLANPGDAEARLLLGQVHLRNLDGLSAEKEIRRAQELGLAEEGWGLDLVEALLLQGRNDEAKRMVEEYAESHLRDARASVLQGRVSLALGEWYQANQAFQAAMEFGGADEEARLGLIRTALAQFDKTKAQSLLNALLRDYPSNTDALMIAAAQHRDAGDMDNATAYYQRAVDSSPEDPLALAGLAASRIALGEYEVADTVVAELERIRPNTAIAAYLRGLSLYLRGQLAEALPHLDRCLSADPAHAQSRALAGVINYTQGNYETATEHLKIALATNPDNRQVRKLLAAAMIHSGDGRSAIDVLEQVDVETAPDLLALRGNAYIALGDNSQAQESLSLAAAAGSASLSAVAQTQLGKLKLDAGELDEALSALEAAAANDAQPILSDILRASALIEAGRYEQALEIADAVADRLPESPLPFNLKGVIYIAQGSPDEAQAQFEQALTIAPEFTAARLLLARLELARGRPRLAEKRLMAGLEITPKQTTILTLLAEIALSTGDSQRALTLLRDTIDTQPDAIAPRILMTRILLDQERLEPALEAAKSLAARAPRNIDILKLTADIQMRAGDHTGAELTLSQLTDIAPDNPDLHLFRGILNLRYGENAAAKEDIQRALYLQPQNNAAKLMLARAYLALHQTDEAMRVAKQIQQDQPDIPLGYQLAAELLLEQGNSSQAIEQLETGLEASGQSRDTVLLLANAYARTGRTDDQAQVLRSWLDAHPDDIAIGADLALTLTRQGQAAEALQVYEGIHNEQAPDPSILNNMALLMHRLGRPEAEQTAADAYRLAPDNALVADTYGWILQQQGRSKEAVALLRQANAALPAQPTIAYHLATALAATGQQRAAATLLKEATLENRRFPERDEAVALLKRLGD